MTRDEALKRADTALMALPFDHDTDEDRSLLATAFMAIYAEGKRAGMERAAEICGEVENLHEDFADGAIECFDRIHESIREESRRG